ncbi:helix-turn-helix transcriptional regulator [Bowdeniella massiliensis]|uniref:helix-turn-helix transcriptional regulator n=1 Tax=Bowdeniella massiliensis TaxID=2932264 RepID=UPI00202918BC|nr:WYL domain-containing protein [Bowdeniella massiliensis]
MRAEFTRDHFPRLLGLLTYLAETGGAHIDELAFHFGVSPDRIREDLNTLWVAGLPGESPEDLIDFTFDDEDTYVALREGLGLDRPLRLTPRETISVLLALRAIEGEVTGTLLRNELTSLIASLEAQLPATTPSRQPDPSLEALRAAARGRDVVTFTYVSATDETSQRTIDPLRIEERSAGWFLIGYCHDSGGIRTFRIDRISNVQLSDASWCAPQDALAGHADIPEMTSVQLVTEPALNWLAEKFSARDMTRRSDGRIEFTIEFYSKERMVRTLLSVADRIESISPPEAAALVADRAQQALARLEA